MHSLNLFYDGLTFYEHYGQKCLVSLHGEGNKSLIG